MSQHIESPQKAASERNGPRKGLVQVYTGPGKEKTTVALGQALCAAGHGLKAIMIRFSRHDFQHGEHLFISNHQLFEIVQLSQRNSTKQSGGGLYLDVQKAFAHAERVLWRGNHDLVTSDDIFKTIDMGALNVEHVLYLMRVKPP
ncbi:MAG: cob(I)yrinic acid a,c-diamide adenosyltransferase [Dehalococcoidia bacterium]|nr:cob(I)yrinic acid a,c-diamide adenosyltransferase [Dehalococcoidia bacterium]